MEKKNSAIELLYVIDRSASMDKGNHLKGKWWIKGDERVRERKRERETGGIGNDSLPLKVTESCTEKRYNKKISKEKKKRRGRKTLSAVGDHVESPRSILRA